MSTSSYLFVPASRPDRFAKALASGAHAVILDLEDAVGSEDKNIARQHVLDWLAQGSSDAVLLRINGRGTPWFEQDLLVASHPGIAAVVVPKAESPEDLGCFGGKPVLPLIETARGVAGMAAIANHPDVDRLVFGTYDFIADLGLGTHPDALLAFKSQFVLCSRLHGLPPPVDGVMASVTDPTGWSAEAGYARQLGFGGKLCIHPAQVAAVNAAFLPSDAELEWARKVLAVVSKGAAVAVLDGQFIDKPVVTRARAIVGARTDT